MKPILFNTEMVRAILDGRKRQTRRVVKTGSYTPLEIGRSKFYTFRDELNGKPGAWAGFYCNRDMFIGKDGEQHIDAVYAKLSYLPGDILWVRETWNTLCGQYIYRADQKPGMKNPGEWRPSIHMPKEAARIFLRVTGVRVERLQEMSYFDFLKEGLPYNQFEEKLEKQFKALWDSTIKPGNLHTCSWDVNPWVWVIEFERREEPEEE